LARLEAERWREALARDVVAVRLISLCDLLEDEVAVLEKDVRDGRFAVAKASEVPPQRPRSFAPTIGAPPVVMVDRVPSPPASAPAPPPAAAEPAAARASASLTGKLEEGLLADVLQMISANHKSGLLRIDGGADEILIWFVDGEVHHAQAGDMRGENAFFAALGESKGTFRFEEMGGDLPERSITSKTQFLILEGLRQIDEEGQSGGEVGEEQ